MKVRERQIEYFSGREKQNIFHWEKYSGENDFQTGCKCNVKTRNLQAGNLPNI